LLALGQLEIDGHPTAALAYTLASLEHADSPEARRFMLRALWRGPPAFTLGKTENLFLDFSPDGEWLAVAGSYIGVQLWSREGGPPRTLVAPEAYPPILTFGPDSDTLFVASQLTGNYGRSIRFLSVPDGEEIRRLDFDVTMPFGRQGNSLITFGSIDENTRLIKAWPLPYGEAETIGRLDFPAGWDLIENKIVYRHGRKLFLRSLDAFNSASDRLIGEHESELVSILFAPNGQWAVAGDEGGEIRFWPLKGDSKEPIRRFQVFESARRISLDPTGKWMASGYRRALPTNVTSWLWDLQGPPDVDPLPLRNSQVVWRGWSSFHPDGRWLAVAHSAFGTALWPLNDKYSRVLRGHSGIARVAFHPNGESLISASYDGTMRTWPLHASASSGGRTKVLLNEANATFHSVALDSDGRNALVSSRFDRGRVVFVPLQGDSPRLIAAKIGQINASTLSDDGRLAAASVVNVGLQTAEIRVWNLDSGQVQVLDLLSDTTDQSRPLIQRGGVYYLRFMPDGHLFSAGGSGFRLWDLSTGTYETLREVNKGHAQASTSQDGRYAVFIENDVEKKTSDLTVYDMVERRSWSLSEHGNLVGWASAFDPTGTVVVTGDGDGVVRVGPITGEPPHLLFGHRKEVMSVAVSPDGRWIASSDFGGEIRLWPMPEGPPFHTLPYEELLDKLRSLTNLRVVPDEEASIGYRFDYAPFPGWEKVPEW
jgi:WD40 repeat protein